jgi:tetratricopeptide (TPR) repeat protein
VGDLFKFSQTLSTNQLLSKKYLNMYLNMRNIKKRPPIRNIPEKLIPEFFGTCGNGFVGEISTIEDPDTKEKETLYWHDGTYKLFKSNHFHYTTNDQIIIICSNCSFLCEGNEMVLKIYQLINNRPLDHILIKHSLSQYISEDIFMHAGIQATIDEYFRHKNDTRNFIIPDKDWFLWAGRTLAEMGDLDGAILIIQAILSEYPDYWEAYDALGEKFIMKGDNDAAIESIKKSLELNPQNTHAQEMLEKLEKK